MSNKDLQRVTKCVSYIGQPVSCRRALANHLYCITQKVKVTSQCSFYTSVHDYEHPSEICLRLKRSDRSAELIGLYDVVARLMSLTLQYGAPLEKVGDLLAGAKFAPCAQCLDTIASSLARVSQTSLVGINWWSLAAVMTAHVPQSTNAEETPS